MGTTADILACTSSSRPVQDIGPGAEGIRTYFGFRVVFYSGCHVLAGWFDILPESIVVAFQVLVCRLAVHIDCVLCGYCARAASLS